jgi:hypothetical protein
MLYGGLEPELRAPESTHTGACASWTGSVATAAPLIGGFAETVSAHKLRDITQCCPYNSYQNHVGDDFRAHTSITWDMALWWIRARIEGTSIHTCRMRTIQITSKF